MFSPQQEKGLLKNACEYNFSRKNPSIAVEIHWRFHPEYCSVPFDDLVGLKPYQADYDAFPMPDLVYPFYWIVRPVRLFYQYGLKKRI